MKNIELLAPVGSMESLYAAIQNGADAVYLGGKFFNARQYASNFEQGEIEEAVKYAHLRGVKVYITTNILIDNSEMESIIEYIKFLYEADVDALIVQDIGLADLIKKFFPQLEIHASTQMTTNNLHGTKFLHGMGFSRAVLARETPLDEIKYISENTPIELEAFIHGALCVSYSGQCLMSSVIGGRSGNRGKCAQPCRMPSSIVGKDGRLVEGWDKKHILSTRDLNTIEDIDKIISAGIVSLKIEGRMKRPEYVATIVKNYRKVLDSGIEALDKKDMEDIEQIFNRGFTKGAMLGSFGNDFVSVDRPDNRGLFIGNVLRADKYKVYIKLEKDLNIGDGIEFRLSNGSTKGLKSTLDAKAGDIATFEKPGYIENGTPVYKTSSVDLLERAKESYEGENILYKINADVNIKIGELAQLKLSYKGNEVTVLSDKKVEVAKKAGLTDEKVREQISKLGGTNYILEDLNINLDGNSFLPLSVLNKLRRDATGKLDSIIEITNDRKPIDVEEYKDKKREVFRKSKIKTTSKRKLSIKVNNVGQFERLNLDKLDRIYLNYKEGLKSSVKKLNDYNKEVYISTDKILYEKDLKELGEAIKSVENDIDGINVSNIGSFKYMKDRFDLSIHGDIGLNVFNSHSLGTLNKNGIQSLTLSPELTLNQIREINEKSEVSTETIVYGRLPVMVTKYCPMSPVKGCKDDSGCKNCDFSSGYKIKDRMNVEFPMERRGSFSTIYNSVPIMVLDSLDSIYSSGVDMARLDFTVEDEEVSYIQEIFYDFAKGNIDIEEARQIISDYRFNHDITNGHYFRGIM